MGGHRHAGLVRGLDDPLLDEIRQAHVSLDEIEAEGLGAGHVALHQRAAVERDATRVVDPRAVQGLTRRHHARANPHARVDGLAILVGLERVRRRVANRRDAKRQPDAPEHLAVALREMGVALDEAGQHGLARRVHDGAAVQVVAVRLDLPDAIALDHDIDRLAGAGVTTVEETSGVDGGDGGPRRPPRLP